MMPPLNSVPSFPRTGTVVRAVVERVVPALVLLASASLSACSAQDDPYGAPTRDTYGAYIDAPSGIPPTTVLVNGYPVLQAGLGDGDSPASYALDLTEEGYGRALSGLNRAMTGERDTVQLLLMPRPKLTANGVTVEEVRGTAWLVAYPEVVERPNGLIAAYGGSQFAKSVAGPLDLSVAFDRWLAEARPKWQQWDAPQEAELRAIVESGRQPTEADVWIDDSVAVWVRRNPIVVTAVVEEARDVYQPASIQENHYLFRQAPVLTDTARVRAFALGLLDRLRTGDLDGAAALFRPPYPWLPKPQPGAAPPDGLRDLYEHGGLALGPDDVGVRPWAGGRVWEVYRRGKPARLTGRSDDDALLQAEVPRPARTDPDRPPPADFVPVPPAPATQSVRRRVYVAEVGGELYVVR